MFFATAANAACPPGNLLNNRAPSSSRSTQYPERLSDGFMAREGDPATLDTVAPMKGLRPYVEWDLGEPTRLVAAVVQADNNDSYRLSISVDGRSYAPLWDVEKAPESGVRERTKRDLSGEARFVRFEALSGDDTYAAAEVKVYCEVPLAWPPPRLVRNPDKPQPGEIGDGVVQSTRLVVGLIAIPLLFLLYPRLRERGKRRLSIGLIVLASLAWFQFGRFIGGTPLHYWDMFHYFMGSKYFEENGYFDLYRCGAKAEREAGNDAEIDKTPIRDLETNDQYTGDWTRTEAGKCRAHFSDARWSSFRADIQTFHGIFQGYKLPDAFSDHGFNATPSNAAWLRMWTHNLTASRSHLIALTMIDSVALILSVAAIYWGFGPLAATVTAVALGVGSFWSFHWVGGTLGRHVWLAWCTFGFALLAKRRFFGGGAALAVAGLLRLFPLGFLGGAIVWAIVKSVRERRLDADGKRLVAGAALAFTLGNAVTVAAVGTHAYRDFGRVFDRHSHTPSGNQLGLMTLLAYDVGQQNLVDGRLTEPSEPWTQRQLQRRVERRPIWAVATIFALGTVALSAVAGLSAAECAALSGLVLFCWLPMTSYDYTWLVVLVALAARRPKILPALLAFAVFSHVLILFGGVGSMLEQHLIGSALCVVLLVWAADVPWLYRRLVTPPPAESGTA
jgi:hypothetical protein